MVTGAEHFPLNRSDDDRITLRTMNYADLRHIMQIEERAYSHPWTIGIFRDCIRVGYNCWVGIIKGRIVGYGVIMLAAGEAHILNLCVDPEHQSKGLGRRILQHLVTRCAQTDIDMVILEVRRSNDNARALYHSEGFHEIGVRKDYYPHAEGREDAIIFARYVAAAEAEEWHD